MTRHLEQRLRAVVTPLYGALLAAAILVAPSDAQTPLPIGETAAWGSAGFVHVGSPNVVVELPSGCAITLDGIFNFDWSTASCAPVSADPVTMTGPPSITAGKLAISHHAHPDPGPPFDTLYVFIGVTGDNTGTDGGDDNVVVMLDTKHDGILGMTDDRGIRFKRDTNVDSVSGNPETPTSLGSFTGTNCTPSRRICILTTGAQWSIEAKLLPSDFGLKAFAGTVGAVVVLRDNSVGTIPHWPSGATASPSTWADLKLGNPVDLMLVLDLSGSMLSPACSPTCDPKIDVLKQAVELFVQLFDAVAVPADHISVRYFKTTIDQFPATGELVAVLDNASAVIADVNARSASNLTAMGGGLQSAINHLTDASRPRSVIAFTDGMQNVNPMVRNTAGQLTIDVDPLVPIGSGISPTTPPTELCTSTPTCTTNLGIRIYTIGVGATPTFVTLLSDIASKTDGAFQGTTDPDVDLTLFFVNDLIKVLRSSSPQLLAYRHGKVSDRTATEVFTTNSTSRKIVLKLSWQQGDSLTFLVDKDGVDVTDGGEIIRGQFYQIFVMDLPAEIHGTAVTPGGEWHMRIFGPSGVGYEAAAISNELLLEYDVSLGRRDYAVGDTLELRVNVAFGGQPVTDARVTATLLKPRQGIGTLLSVNPMPPTPPGFEPEPAATPAQNKLQLLLLDAKLWQSIQPVGQGVTLRSNGDGTYSASFSGTDVEGVYTAVFQIEGERPDVGVYRRTETVSKMVHFGKAEFAASAVRVTQVDETPAGRQLLLHIRPRDRFGNFLGPDYSDRISVSVSPGSVGPDKKDLVDGSYTIPLLVPPATDPLVTIRVMDQAVFDGRLSELEALKRFAFSLHAGVSLPHGSFSSAADPGIGVTGDLEVRLSRTLTVEALFGFHRFNGVAPSADVHLTQFSGGLKAYLTPGPTRVFVSAGGGTYTFDPGTTDPGAHAGAGVQVNPSLRLALEAVYTAHTVFTSGSNTTFSSIQAGGRVRF